VLMEGSSSHRDLGVEGLSLDLAAIVHGLVGDEMKPWSAHLDFPLERGITDLSGHRFLLHDSVKCQQTSICWTYSSESTLATSLIRGRASSVNCFNRHPIRLVPLYFLRLA
jgi:hypothetical protein